MATRTLEKKTKVVKAVRVVNKAIIEKSKTKKVVFAYFAPEAKEVFVAGTFNNWNEKEFLLKKDMKGYWKLPLRLSGGHYEYRYVVDGSWMNDQEQHECAPNSFGTWNSVIQVQV